MPAPWQPSIPRYSDKYRLRTGEDRVAQGSIETTPPSDLEMIKRALLGNLFALERSTRPQKKQKESREIESKKNYRIESGCDDVPQKYTAR